MSREVRLFVDQSTGEAVTMARVFAPLLPGVTLWEEVDRAPTGDVSAMAEIVDGAVRAVRAEEARLRRQEAQEREGRGA